MEMLVENGVFRTPAGTCVTGTGRLQAAFDVTGFAVATMAEAGHAVARLVEHLGDSGGNGDSGLRSDSGLPVSLDLDLAERWFGMSFAPVGWELPPVWDPIAGDYPCDDGWIRLHTNAPHHRAAALQVLGLSEGAERTTAAAAVERWQGEELEAAIVAANGCAAVMRSQKEWAVHPQGCAVAVEPLVHWGVGRPVDVRTSSQSGRMATVQHPLQGVRVLDLTRVIAGPVATRFLALYGAEVLRLDPLDWQEPALEAEMTLGKHCARLNFKSAEGLALLHSLLGSADILVQGYRPDALDRLGLSAEELAEKYPQLVNVALDAYGWRGPWALRRGFDSLVQMSCGIAHSGMRHGGSTRPLPLPVQALDHATGYLCAAAVLDAWRARLGGTVRNARLSLARTGAELMRSGPCEQQLPKSHEQRPAVQPGAEPALVPELVPEGTRWGPGVRLPWALHIPGLIAETSVPARGYGSAPPAWPDITH